MKRAIPTGCASLDALLQGGLPIGALALAYGEPETGKTTLAIQCAVNCARMGLKALFVDSDHTFSARRLLQIAQGDEEALQSIALLRPKDFKEQSSVVDKLESLLTEGFGLIVFDTITSLYRSELSEDVKRVFSLNRELNRQMAYLAQVAKSHGVAVLVNSQVRSVVREGLGRAEVEPVATRALKFWPDVRLRLELIKRPRVVRAVLEKPLGLEGPKSCLLRMEETGLRELR